LGGKYNTAGTTTPFAWLIGAKENATDGNQAGYLSFTTTENGGGFAERMRITSTGNVGIGTTSPDVYSFGGGKLLTVSDTSTYSVIVLASGGSNSGGISMGNQTIRRAAIDHLSGSDLAFYTNGSNSGTTVTERLRITSAGNVGIGTTAPGALLQVGLSNTTSNALLRLGVIYDGSRSSRGGITWHDASNNTGKIYTEYDGTMVSMVFGSLYNSGYNSNQLMIIRGNGNVGIGTTSPGYKLSVAGNGHSWNVNPHVAGVDLYSTGNIAPHYQSTFDWFTGAPGGGTFKMRLDASGNLGINTTSPSYKLDVVGDARITSGSLGVGVAPNATDGRIDASNDIVAYQTSDQRLKENVTPIENALEKVKSLTGVEFDWIEEHKHIHGYEGHDTGVIAQQVQAVMPTAVRTNDSGYLSVRYEKMIALLIEGMKEQQKEIDELKSKLK
jgi:hypothetical protein